MAIHTLHSTQVIETTLDEAWSFFSNPRNLARITPPSLGFEVRTKDLPDSIHAGLMIEYRVRPLLGIPTTWLTEITQVRERAYFVDEQRIGPYRIWHHEHGFRELAPGRVEIEDRVTYVVPFGPLGTILHKLVIQRRLAEIFEFRKGIITGLFSPVENSVPAAAVQ
ncbi:MAG: SRPBCC family protein [Planctomycetes bacterium]|nr:SRPBCC family protein [Planctomycetota bacterium]MCB9917606.1 SRPBCC family protein [Planctomycetota bacterium]